MKKASKSTIVFASAMAVAVCWIVFRGKIKRAVKVQVRNVVAELIAHEFGISREITRSLIDLITS